MSRFRRPAALGGDMHAHRALSVVALAVAAVGGTALGCGPPLPTDPAGSELHFERHVLVAGFVAEAIGVFDVDADGALDLVVPPYWWSGPNFSRHELAAPSPERLDPRTDYASVYGVYPWDVNDDGCLDVVVPSREIDAQMFWLESPHDAGGRCGDRTVHWAAHPVVPGDWDMTLEGPIVATVGESERLALLSGRRVEGHDDTAELGWWAPGPDPTLPWEFHAISEPDFRSAHEWYHGIGAGDVNDDGRTDVLTTDGWFEGPSDPETSPWALHPFPAIADDAADPMLACSRLRLHDVDLDGRGDLICGRPHHFGLYWWRQIDGAGSEEISFERHVVDETMLSAMHAVRTDDLDGDGIGEIVTGERYAATFGSDPLAPRAPPLVYYAVSFGEGEPRFTQHLIDADSGVGIQFEVADLDADGRLDVAVATKRGVFYFLQR